MLRLTEILLFLAPLAAFLVWRRTAASGGPSVFVLAAGALGLLVLASALAWLAASRSLGRAQHYVPARLEDGRVISGHAAP
jgi:threonine dehydrogenase-like Zn-dependent dehydrogenase